MQIHTLHDETTRTFSYVLVDEATNKCAIIDPVLDYNPDTGRVHEDNIEKIKDTIQRHNLTVEWILETHAHADHLSGAFYLKRDLGGKIGIGEHIKAVIEHWVPLFDTDEDTPLDGSQFDHLFKDQESFALGSLTLTVMHTPGHTPACVSYLIDGHIFVGDTLFMPEIGTARTDFPGGSAETLYDSIRKILSLPESTQIHTCHDYPEGSMPAKAVSTVAEQKASNSMIREGISKGDYVLARNKKDAKKAPPKLLLPSLQVNLRAGYLGNPAKNNRQYIKIPINLLS